MSLLLGFTRIANQNKEMPDKRLFLLPCPAVPYEVIESVGAQFINGRIESSPPVDLRNLLYKGKLAAFNVQRKGVYDYASFRAAKHLSHCLLQGFVHWWPREEWFSILH